MKIFEMSGYIIIGHGNLSKVQPGDGKSFQLNHIYNQYDHILKVSIQYLKIWLSNMYLFWYGG